MGELENEAHLVLADGGAYEGRAMGWQPPEGITRGELVFNTSITGYQEILTDPSYAGQVVLLTYQHIGINGANPEDSQSRRATAEGLVVGEISRYYSNPRATQSLNDFLIERRISAIDQVDTRAVTRRIRDLGVMACAFGIASMDQLHAAAALPIDINRVPEVSTKRSWRAGNGAWRIVVYDFGVKYGILQELLERNTQLLVVPWDTSADAVLDRRPHGVVLSNGPGDPSTLPEVVVTVGQLIERLPVLGICLGQQLLGQALGGYTEKLQFGHHAANHPVRDTRGRVLITSQNHNFAVVDNAALQAEVTHRSLNDGAVEGLRSRDVPAFGVQYHPEGAPGPHDSRPIFDEFVSLLEHVHGRIPAATPAVR